jgi:hypothetical protein
MIRKLVCFVVTLCIGWQTLAFAGVDVLVSEAQEQTHELLHFLAEPHHHDDHHAGLHEDDSPASKIHIMADAGVFAAALLPSSSNCLCASIHVQPPMSLALFWATAHLDDFYRPPRLTA